MKRIFLMFTLLFVAVLFYGAAPASAASAGEAQIIAQLAGTAKGVVKVGGYYGYGSDDYYDRGRRYDDVDDGDDDDDDDVYREGRLNSYDYNGGGGYCSDCADRCRDGWCPPQCHGWWRQCRRGY